LVDESVRVFAPQPFRFGHRKPPGNHHSMTDPLSTTEGGTADG
jgi:hypothetical protein